MREREGGQEVSWREKKTNFGTRQSFRSSSQIRIRIHNPQAVSVSVPVAVMEQAAGLGPKLCLI